MKGKDGQGVLCLDEVQTVVQSTSITIVSLLLFQADVAVDVHRIDMKLRLHKCIMKWAHLAISTTYAHRNDVRQSRRVQW